MTRQLLLILFSGATLAMLSACFHDSDDDDADNDDDPNPTYTLYFSQDLNPNGLYSIDVTTGLPTLVGAGNSGVTGGNVGLAHREAAGGNLVGSRDDGLLVINRDGSGSMFVGGLTEEALAYDNTMDILYACDSGNFRTIDPATGAQITDLPDTGDDFEGLAVEPNTGDVFGLASGNPADLWRYDQGTSMWNMVGSTNLNMDNVGLAYHPVTGVLYVLDGLTGNLYTLDTATGAPTLIGPHGLAGQNGGGLAFALD